MKSNFTKLYLLPFSTFTLATATIYGSKHDLTYLTLSKPIDEGTLCVICHTPHGSNSKFSGSFIWDQDIPINEVTYTVYNEQGEEKEKETNPSKACLSCHDGVSAINAMSQTSTNEFIHSSNQLEKGHPVSIEYKERRASLNPISGSLGANTNGYSAHWDTPDGSQNIASVLKNNKIECSSCHDPHLGQNSVFLRVKNNFNSLLCLGCHTK